MVLLTGVAVNAAAESTWLSIAEVSAPAYYDKWLPKEVLNWDDTTSWQYNKKKTEEGGYQSYIILHLPIPSTVEWLYVKNGFWKITDGLDQYWRNCRARDVLISFRYECDDYFSDAFWYTFADEKEVKNIPLGGRKGVSAIKFEIVSVYEGERFKDDVAITYMGIYGSNDWSNESNWMIDAWRPIPAWLNQKMATRTGPGTQYTETHGTLSQDTDIIVYQRELDKGGVSWCLVEFMTRGGLVRAYTGEKRIETDGMIPWGPSEPEWAVVGRETQAFFGPSAYYKPSNRNVEAGTVVEVWGRENGYTLIEYLYTESQYIRVWVPETVLMYYYAEG